MAARYRPVSLGDLTPIVDRRADGTMIVHAAQPLEPYPSRVTERLLHWAAVAPDRTLLAWRGGSLTYGDAVFATRALGQALLDRGLSATRPLAILSGNDREHFLLTLAALHVGIPCAPISPAYSLLSTDFGTMNHALGRLKPALVYASDANAFSRAIAAAVPAGVEVVSRGTAFDALLNTTPTTDVDRAHNAITPDTIAKILFTSGSTGLPKGVLNTHRMLTSNQQMILQALPVLAEEPPVLVDWLPCHHTFGGNHNVGLVLYNGGTLHIDDGRPMPGAFDESVRNLRDIAPTMYLNVPKGYEELARALRHDVSLATMFFSRLRLLFYAAASLPQRIADEMQAIAEDTIGERIVFVTGFGSTETAPMAICRPWATDAAAVVGLPVPGLTAKLVPSGGRLEVRVSGPNVMPGYLDEPDITRAAFDDEGFYCLGDAFQMADADDVNQGFVFDGRLAEDFKLLSGTWVIVGPLRLKAIAHFAPYVRDVVITGHGRNEVGMLAVPDVAACRELCPETAASAPTSDVLNSDAVRERMRALVASFAAGSSGSSTRITRAMLLEEPASMDAGEITDKGSLNQRAILERRAALVEALYDEQT